MIKFAVFAPEMTWKHVRNTFIVLSERYHNSKVSILEVNHLDTLGYNEIFIDFQWDFRNFPGRFFGGWGGPDFLTPKSRFQQIDLIFGRFRMSTCGLKKIRSKNIIQEQFQSLSKKSKKNFFFSILGTATQGTFKSLLAAKLVQILDLELKTRHFFFKIGTNSG